MSLSKEILQSFSNNDTVGTIETINNALYARANEYINSRKQIVAQSIFNNDSNDEDYTE
jgi:hypothetical protein